MKRLVLTGWRGEAFSKIAEHTVPLIETYAAEVGADFRCDSLQGDRPASWNKIPALLLALQEYDEVLWIDADVVVIRSDNLFDNVPAEAWQALVEHRTGSRSIRRPNGFLKLSRESRIPNCGVWLVRKAMLPVLEKVWGLERYVEHPWWEQAALISEMGYTTDTGVYTRLKKKTDLYRSTHFLGLAWNHTPLDNRNEANPVLCHIFSTTYNRLDVIAELAGRSGLAR
jgi:hypothetical protein